MGLPGDYSCICKLRAVIQGSRVCERAGLTYHVGNVLSSDMFYGPAKSVQGGMTWSDMGVLAVEMEAAALYTNRSSRCERTGAS